MHAQRLSFAKRCLFIIFIYFFHILFLFLSYFVVFVVILHLSLLLHLARLVDYRLPCVPALAGQGDLILCETIAIYVLAAILAALSLVDGRMGCQLEMGGTEALTWRVRGLTVSFSIFSQDSFTF